MRLIHSHRESKRESFYVCVAENVRTNTHFQRQTITEKCECISIISGHYFYTKSYKNQKVACQAKYLQ